MSKIIKVAHVLKCMDMGGIETLLMNFYKNIDRKKVQFIFILFSNNKSFYEDEIENLGGVIYHIGQDKNFFKQIKKIRHIIKKEEVDVVHSHTLFYSGIVLLAARLEKVKIRIAHSHSKNDNKRDNYKRKIVRKIASLLIKKTANVYIACSKEASEYLYGKKMTYNNRTIILRNGIQAEKYLNIEKYKIDDLIRTYNLNKQEYTIVMVARLAKEKNHEYAIKIAENLKERKEKFKMFFVGDGPLEEELKKEVKQKDLSKEIIFTGVVEEPEIYFKVSDVSILPSKFEGFGMTVLESQATKTICIVSKNVPDEADLGIDLVQYLDVTENSIDKWIEIIKNSKKTQEIPNEKVTQALIDKGLDIKETVKVLLKIYQGERI